MKKTKRIDIRVTEDELNKLRESAKDYPTLTSFILDASKHFNAKRHLKQIAYLDEKFDLLEQHKVSINKIGSNLNQLVQYTNNSMKVGVYLPQTGDEIVRLQQAIFENLQFLKSELQSIENRLIAENKKL